MCLLSIVIRRPLSFWISHRLLGSAFVYFALPVPPSLSCPQSCWPLSRRLPRPVAMGFAFLLLPTLGTKTSGCHESLSKHIHQTKDIHTEATISQDTERTYIQVGLHTDGTYTRIYIRMGQLTDKIIYGWDTRN